MFPHGSVTNSYGMRPDIKPSPLRRLDSPWVPLVIVSIVYLLFIHARLSTHGYDASFFVTAGDKFCDPNLVPKNLRVMNNSAGYDGQFYYRLALNPFTSMPTEFGVRFDSPWYRQQRIVYPLIVWVLSLGRFDLVPMMMIVVNYLALCFIGLIGGSYAQSMKQHALWGIVLPLYPGFLLTLSRDLPEVLQICFLLASLLLIRRGRHLFATLLLTLAILTKETSLLVGVAAMFVGLAEAWTGKETRLLKWHFSLLPLISYAIWQLLLFYRWEHLPLRAASYTIGLPLSGFIKFFLYTITHKTESLRLLFAELCLIILFAIFVAYSLRSTVAWTHEKLSWSLYVILVSSFTRPIWVEDWAFFRALSEFYVLGAIILIGSRFKLRASLLVCSTVLWLLLFSNIIGMR